MEEAGLLAASKAIELNFSIMRSKRSKTMKLSGLCSSAYLLLYSGVPCCCCAGKSCPSHCPQIPLYTGSTVLKSSLCLTQSAGCICTSLLLLPDLVIELCRGAAITRAQSRFVHLWCVSLARMCRNSERTQTTGFCEWLRLRFDCPNKTEVTSDTDRR